MLVDDHPLFRRGLASLLASYDERFDVVCEASDVTEALKLAKSTPVELILLDNHLPGVRGVDAIMLFKELDPELKIVMMTVSRSKTVGHMTGRAGSRQPYKTASGFPSWWRTPSARPSSNDHVR